LFFGAELFGYDAGMDPLELLGFVTGGVCVWLAARENIWNWPIGIANNIFYLIVFWRAGLYADSGLQIFYFAIAVYGWWMWAWGGKGHRELPATRTPPKEVAVMAGVTLISGVVLYIGLRRFTNSTVPAGDAITTALSLTAQYMLGRKWFENWVVWIAADVIYVGLYFYKHLYWTALLYAIFIAMCVGGYRGWKRTMSEKSLAISV
jgi:nicotinamide mononucleotide transporter